jgi:exosortase
MRPVSYPIRLEDSATRGHARIDGALRWVPFAVALAAVLAVYAPVLADMAVEWATFPSLSHGFAVPLISAYLVWRRRELIGVEPLGSASVGLVVFVVALGIFEAGSLSGETFFSRLSFPLALLGIALFLAGPRVTGHVWPAIAYLLFMIPFPYLTFKAVTYQSRLFEAGVTATALRWLGVPILQQGVMLHLPRVTLEVADDCSGVRAVAALVAVGTAYAQIQPRATWTRVTLTLAAAPLGLVSNIFRLVLTALGVYYLGPITLTSVFHRFNGTVVFLTTVVLLAGLDRLLVRMARPALR